MSTAPTYETWDPDHRSTEAHTEYWVELQPKVKNWFGQFQTKICRKKV